MPYRFHPTKRGLYKLVAEKAAELSWLELPKSSEMLFEHGKHSAWLRWPYHEIYFTPSPYPLLAVEQYGDAPSDEAKRVRQRKVFNFSLADLQAYGLIKTIRTGRLNRSPTLSCTKSRLPIRFLSAGLQA